SILFDSLPRDRAGGCGWSRRRRGRAAAAVLLGEPALPALKRRLALVLVEIILVPELLPRDSPQRFHRVKPHRGIVAIQTLHELRDRLAILRLARLLDCGDLRARVIALDVDRIARKATGGGESNGEQNRDVSDVHCEIRADHRKAAADFCNDARA